MLQSGHPSSPAPYSGCGGAEPAGGGGGCLARREYSVTRGDSHQPLTGVKLLIPRGARRFFFRPTQLLNQFIFRISFTRPCQPRGDDFCRWSRGFGVLEQSLALSVEHRDGRVIMVTAALTDRDGVCSSTPRLQLCVCICPSVYLWPMIPCCLQQKNGFAGQRSSSLLSWFSWFNSFCLLTIPKFARQRYGSACWILQIRLNKLA